jgi:parallel beta-helix repeat protein
MNAALNCRITNNYVDSPSNIGIYVFNASHYNIVSHNEVISSTVKGISVYNGSQYNLIHSNYVENSGEAGIFVNDASSATHANYNSVVGNTIYRTGISHANGGNGIEIGAEQIGSVVSNNFVFEAGYDRAGEALTSCSGISVNGPYVNITGNFVHSALYHGIYLLNAGDCVVSNNTVINSSQDSVGGYDGIRVHGASSVRNVIDGNQCVDDLGTARQDYGLREASSADYNIFTNNLANGNNTGDLVVVGSNTMVVGFEGECRIGDGVTNYTAIEPAGDVTFVGGAGLQFAEIYAHDVAADITSVAQNDWDQITAFDTNGNANGATPDHTNDHITISKAGMYSVSYTWSGHAHASHDWDLHISKNNNATTFNNTTSHFSTPTAGRIITYAGIGILDLAANDTVELWVRRTSAGSNVDLTTDSVALNLVQVGGT